MNVLIIGLGSIAKKHIKSLKELVPEVSFFALRSHKNAQKIEGIENIFSYDEINDNDFDFIIISNPTNKHKETISKLIDFKIPLFIEKPLFDSLDNDELVKKLDESDIQNYIACNLRFLDSINFVKNYIKGKRVNEVNIYCGSFLPDWRPGVDFRTVYSANKNMGGGVHIDLIHEIDYTYWIFGEPIKVHSIQKNHSHLAISATDYANFVFIYEKFCVNIILNYYRRDAKRTFEVVMEEGTITADLIKNEVEYNGEIIFSSKQKIIDTYKVQLDYYINHILKSKEKQLNSITEAYQILKLCMEN